MDIWCWNENVSPLIAEVEDDKKNVQFKYPKVPYDVIEKVCSKAYLDAFKHYRLYSFVVNERFKAES